MAGKSHPVFAEFPAHHFVSASGVAIFHVKTGRVVLCYHTRDKYWFLPKGRRDAGESSTCAAEREGFEEVWVKISNSEH
jgi:8-oxo-dGTP pyrophosphatase MutT (NUDIX family)